MSEPKILTFLQSCGVQIEKGTISNLLIICNPFYTAFFTTKYKNRLSVLEILMTGEENNGKGLSYAINNETYDLLKKLNVGIECYFLIYFRLFQAAY